MRDERWLELFDETVDENFTGPVAQRAKQRATQVASALAVLATRQTQGAKP